MKSILVLKKEMVEVGRRMYVRGYVASHDGNVSVKLDENRILITPTGVSKGFMKHADLVLTDRDGRVLKGDRKPSSEIFMHLKVYQERPDVNSVCHAHPVYATGFAAAGIPLDKHVLPEVVIALGTIPLVEYGTPGTAAFYKPLIPYLKDHDAFLLANHGVLTVGEDLRKAYHAMEIVEHFARIYFVSLQLGRVQELAQEEVEKLIQLRKKFGIRPDSGRKTLR